MARSFVPRPLGEGRVRAILTASPSRIRCRPYNYGEAPLQKRTLSFLYVFVIRY